MVYDEYIVTARDVVADLRAEGYVVNYRIRKTKKGKQRVVLYVRGDEKHDLKRAEQMIKYGLPDMISSIHPTKSFHWAFTEPNK